MSASVHILRKLAGGLPKIVVVRVKQIERDVMRYKKEGNEDLTAQSVLDQQMRVKNSTGLERQFSS